jgi:hypothetical protein
MATALLGELRQTAVMQTGDEPRLANRYTGPPGQDAISQPNYLWRC